MEHLKATLAYINDWNGEDSVIKEEIDANTKDGIDLLVVQKIYNMVPENAFPATKLIFSNLANLLPYLASDVIEEPVENAMKKKHSISTLIVCSTRISSSVAPRAVML